MKIADPGLVRRMRRDVGHALVVRKVVHETELGRALAPAEERQLVGSLVNAALEDHVAACLATGEAQPDEDEEAALYQGVLDAMYAGGAVLQRLLDRPDLEDVFLNGPARTRLRFADGSVEDGPAIWEDEDDMVAGLQELARQSSSPARFDVAAPVMNLRLPDGSRLFAVREISAYPCVAVRKHRYPRLFLRPQSDPERSGNDLVTLGTVDQGLAEFLAGAVRARLNVVVAGGMGDGKTSTLRALLNECDPDERIVTVEDTPELGLDELPDLHRDVVPMGERLENTEGQGAFSLAEIMRQGLRMRAERVIVGEVRGPEIHLMFRAMTQGNDGSMCTIHASSSRGALGRMAMYTELPAEAANVRIAEAVDLVVFLRQGRDPRSGRHRRVVASVLEVGEAEGLVLSSSEIYRPGPDGRAVPSGVPVSAHRLERLVEADFDPGWLAS